MNQQYKTDEDRQRIAIQIKAFLANGGKVEILPSFTDVNYKASIVAMEY